MSDETPLWEPPSRFASPEGPNRPLLLQKRAIKSGWLMILAGILLPFFALGGAAYGIGLIRGDRREAGIPLVAVGVAIFVIRLALWIRTGSLR